MESVKLSVQTDHKFLTQASIFCRCVTNVKTLNASEDLEHPKHVCVSVCGQHRVRVYSNDDWAVGASQILPCIGHQPAAFFTSLRKPVHLGHCDISTNFQSQNADQSSPKPLQNSKSSENQPDWIWSSNFHKTSRDVESPSAKSGG